MNAKQASALANLVAALPELYQPIYGHAEFSTAASRNCEDRLDDIRRAYLAMERSLGRPLRVLDLGCAQGYFGLKLAAMGATVLGADYQAANVAVCRALAAEHPELKIRFEETTIESVLESLAPADYDLVLGLSVFHHLVHGHGEAKVTEWLTALASKVEAAIFELALASEPPYWAAAQPADERSLLAGFAFVHELARHPTHLSGISRPLFFASGRFWYLGGAVDTFSSWKAQSHLLAGTVHRGTRRYYFGDGTIARIFQLDPWLGKTNRKEIEQEAAFLAKPPPAFTPVAKLVASGIGEREAWLVREALPGDLLVELMQAGRPFDARRVLRDVLVQLAALEAVGLFHNDVRVWNVIVGPEGGAALIDYGAISTTREDCVWPRDLVLSFWIFVRDLAGEAPKRTSPERQPFISPYNLPDPYRRWALAVWARPVSEWSFQLLLALLDDPGDSIGKTEDASAIALWMQAIEQHLDTIGTHAHQLEQNSQQLMEKTMGQAQRADQVDSDIASNREESAALRAAIGVQAETFRAVVDFAHGQDELRRLSQILATRERELGAQVNQAQNEVLRLTHALANQGKEMGAQLAQGKVEIAEARTRLDAQSEQLATGQARAEWLKGELNAARIKADELGHSSHHWWTAAVGLSNELESVRASRSWRLTAPLRAVGALANRTRAVVRTGLARLIGLPRRAARRMLLFAVTLVQDRPELKAMVARLVARFPRLDTRLRAFFSSHSPELPAVNVPSAPVLSPELPDEAIAGQVQWETYPPSVHKVYRQLMQARAKTQADTVPDKPSDQA